MLSILLLNAPFAEVVIRDPITDAQTHAFAVASDAGILSLSCADGKSPMTISYVPGRYYGVPRGPALIGPQATHRFDAMSKAERFGWSFERKRLVYRGEGLLKQNKKQAEFLNALAKSSSFAIRYDDNFGQVTTATIEYQVDQTELAGFVAKCASPRVQRYLAEWQWLTFDQ
jgi:hypothetical protein